jgi:hypothetical protein
MAGMAVLATAKADDFREAIDAAFCYGVGQQEIGTSLKSSKSADVSQSIAKYRDRTKPSVHPRAKPMVRLPKTQKGRLATSLLKGLQSMHLLSTRLATA